MTPSDDRLDEALDGFRADEGTLDAAARSRISARVHAATGVDPDASHPSTGSDEDGTDAPDARAMVGRRRVLSWPLTAAAAVILVALIGAAALWSTGDRGTVSSTPRATAPTDAAPRLADLADLAAGQGGAVLGEAGATYAHRVVTRTIEDTDAAGGERGIGRFATWVALDGSGREADLDAPADEGLRPEPGSLRIAGLPPAEAVALPDDVDEVWRVFGTADDGPTTFTPIEVAPAVADALAVAGLPGTARAGMLRALDEVGYRPTGAVDAGTGTARYEIAGGGGGAEDVVVVVDVRTTLVVSIQLSRADGSGTTSAFSEVALRDDLSP